MQPSCTSVCHLDGVNSIESFVLTNYLIHSHGKRCQHKIPNTHSICKCSSTCGATESHCGDVCRSAMAEDDTLKACYCTKCTCRRCEPYIPCNCLKCSSNCEMCRYKLIKRIIKAIIGGILPIVGCIIFTSSCLAFGFVTQVLNFGKTYPSNVVMGIGALIFIIISVAACILGAILVSATVVKLYLTLNPKDFYQKWDEAQANLANLAVFGNIEHEIPYSEGASESQE